jgi:hypothetical protein
LYYVGFAFAGTVVAGWFRRRHRSRLVLTTLLVALALLPWLPLIMAQVPRQAVPPPPHGLPVVDNLFRGLAAALVAAPVAERPVFVGFVAVATGLILGAMLWWRHRPGMDVALSWALVAVIAFIGPWVVRVTGVAEVSDRHWGAVPVAAMLAGVLETVAVYAILRCRGIADQAVSPEFTGGLLALFGLISFTLAAFFILVQHNYKRLFAYSSIEHMGLAMVGFGVGGTIGNFGGFFHLVNHAFAKSLAFFAAGNIHRRFKTVEIDEVRGLTTVLPWTAMALLISGLALAALPPFALFNSELQILTALSSSGLPREWTQPGTRFPVVLLLLCGVVAFAGLLYRITGMVWGSAPKGIVHGEQWSVGHIPIVLLGSVLVGFCLALPDFMRELFEAASALLARR